MDILNQPDAFWIPGHKVVVRAVRHVTVSFYSPPPRPKPCGGEAGEEHDAGILRGFYDLSVSLFHGRGCLCGHAVYVVNGGSFSV